MRTATVLTYTLGKVSDAQNVLWTEPLLEDLCACVLLLTYTLGKVSDAQDVLRTEPLLKELCAGVPDTCELEEGGAEHQVLHVAR
jgi:hypothetical protein